MASLVPARLSVPDVLRVGALGLRTRPLRAFLSALGIAIGIAAMIAVVGISSSSRADLDRALAALGTNLLTVAPGTTMFGDDAALPVESVSMIARIGPVDQVTATGTVPDVNVYRSDRIPAAETGGMSVQAAHLDLLRTVGATLADGAWLNAATARYPAVVLGSAAARRLGIPAAGPQLQVYAAGRWFTVVGVLDPVPLAPELDSAALVGWPAAEKYLGFDGYPTTVYTRSDDAAVDAVRSVLAATANPEAPNEVTVSRPSDALAAGRAVDRTFTALLLGLGAVALLVGGVGVANTMVISVLERRAEIGLRRSLGATRGQVRTQFVAESLLLSLAGGVGGVLVGVAVTFGVRDDPVVADRRARVGAGRGSAGDRGDRGGCRALSGDPGRAAGAHRGLGLTAVLRPGLARAWLQRRTAQRTTVGGRHRDGHRKLPTVRAGRRRRDHRSRPAGARTHGTVAGRCRPERHSALRDQPRRGL